MVEVRGFPLRIEAYSWKILAKREANYLALNSSGNLTFFYFR